MYSEPCQTSKIKRFAKRLHLRCLTRFCIHLWKLRHSLLSLKVHLYCKKKIVKKNSPTYKFLRNLPKFSEQDLCIKAMKFLVLKMLRVMLLGILACIFRGLFRNLSNIYDWLFHDKGSYHIETNPLICFANQWIGFYMIGTFVLKE